MSKNVLIVMEAHPRLRIIYPPHGSFKPDVLRITIWFPTPLDQLPVAKVAEIRKSLGRDVGMAVDSGRREMFFLVPILDASSPSAIAGQANVLQRKLKTLGYSSSKSVQDPREVNFAVEHAARRGSLMSSTGNSKRLTGFTGKLVKKQP